MFVLTFPGHSSFPTIPAMLRCCSLCPSKLYMGNTWGNKSGKYFYVRLLACINLCCLHSPFCPIVSSLLFFVVCSPALTVPETPGDEAALLPYFIMNEGSFQPAHSSLLQQASPSCQPHSLHAPPSWPCSVYMCVCVPHEQWVCV